MIVKNVTEIELKSHIVFVQLVLMMMVLILSVHHVLLNVKNVISMDVLNVAEIDS